MPASGPLHTPCLARSPALPVATGASHLVTAHVWLPQRPLPPACFYFSTLFLSLHPRRITGSDLAGILTTSFLLCNLGSSLMGQSLASSPVTKSYYLHLATLLCRLGSESVQDPATATSSCVLPTSLADAEVCFVTARTQRCLVLTLHPGSCPWESHSSKDQSTQPRRGRGSGRLASGTSQPAQSDRPINPSLMEAGLPSHHPHSLLHKSVSYKT